MLSIIIPTYNSNSNLIRLIEKIYHLVFLEIIVIDDFGDENAFEIKALYPEVTVFRQPKNLGAGAARNVGIKLASKSHITFVDADDLLFPEELQKAYDSICEDDDVSFFTPSSHSRCSKITTRHLKYKSMIQDYLLQSSDRMLYKFHVPWSKIFRREFILKNNLQFDCVSASNDVLFSLCSHLKATKISASNVTFYSVLQHSEGLTGVDSVTRLTDRINVLVAYNRKLREYNKLCYKTTVIPLLIRFMKINMLQTIKVVKEIDWRFYDDFIPSYYSLKRCFSKT